MGEVAEMMLEGFLCEGCGEVMGDMETGEGQGFPGLCAACQADVGDDVVYSLPPPNSNPVRVRQQNEALLKIPAPSAHRCTQCNRRFATEAGLRDHKRMKHFWLKK